MVKYLQLVKIDKDKQYNLFGRRDVKFAYKTKKAAQNKARQLRKEEFNVRVLPRKAGYQLVGQKRYRK